MPRKYGGCFSRKCFHVDEEIEDDEDDDDDTEGYERLSCLDETESTFIDKDSSASPCLQDANDYFKPVDSYQDNSKTDKNTGGRDSYTFKDSRGKRLSKKLRRKETRNRIGHALYSTWKWLKRGLLFMTPGMASMFMLAPSPGNAMATVAARRQAAKECKQTAVFL